MMLRQSERLRRRSSLMRGEDAVLAAALQPSLKRRSRTVLDGANAAAVAAQSKHKAAKLQVLYNVNLFEINLYDIFQLQRFGDEYASFKRTLADSYDLLKRTYTAELGSRAVNDYKTIVRVAEFGHAVLGDDEHKNLYDRYLEAKDGEAYRAIVKRQREFDAARRVAADRLAAAAAVANNVADNNIYAALLHNFFKEKMNSDTQLRPSSFNRILVTWTVHPNNTNNENVTLDVIENYFKYYGSVNGAVMCADQSNCALLEFASSAGVTAALNEKNKIYQITELNKWQINSATKSALKEVFQRVLELEARARDARSTIGGDGDDDTI